MRVIIYLGDKLMNQIIKKVLTKIENNGYEAYLVGGFVRDFLLGNQSYDIDICTNALPCDLNRIFINCQNNNYGGIHFKIKKATNSRLFYCEGKIKKIFYLFNRWI
mgnify:CR=1 FL=1